MAVSEKQENIQGNQKTCEYKGVTYFVLNDIRTGKCFIEVDGERKYLDCNGRVANKQRGTKSIKTAIENFEDMKKIQDYFIKNKQWNFYLLFTLNINTGRRISDLLNARWSDFFYKNGNMRKTWDIKKKDKDGNIVYGEQKTGKSKELYLNRAIQRAFKTFLENEKGIDFTYDYDEPVFMQLHGTIIDNSGQGFVNITFPDFDGVCTCVPEGEDYITSAQDILTLAVLDLEENGEEMPVQMRTDGITVGENQTLIYINVWLPYHKSQVKVLYRKKTLTIPVWIDGLAKANYINFSATLVEAIKEKLSLK